MTRPRGRGRALLAAGAVVVAVGPVAGCGFGGPARTLGTERLRQDLTDAVVEDYGIEALGVDCPLSVPAESGTTFECEVRLEGGVLGYRVTQVDDEGSLRFTPLGAVLDPATPAARIATHYVEAVGKNVDVFCGQRELEYRVVEVGGSFVCRVVDRGGNTDGAVVTVTDVDGEFSFEIRAGDATGAEF